VPIGIWIKIHLNPKPRFLQFIVVASIPKVVAVVSFIHAPV